MVAPWEKLPRYLIVSMPIFEEVKSDFSGMERLGQYHGRLQDAMVLSTLLGPMYTIEASQDGRRALLEIDWLIVIDGAAEYRYRIDGGEWRKQWVMPRGNVIDLPLGESLTVAAA